MNHPLVFRLLFSVACQLTLLACMAAASQARQEWSVLTGPDGNFTIQLPAAPARETKVTPQRHFMGQTIPIYSASVGEGFLFTMNYKNLPARSVGLDRQLVLAEYERGLSLDAWSVVSREKLPNGGWQYEAVTPLQVGSYGSPLRARLRTRVFFRGARMYTLAVMSREPNRPADEAQRFFSSLRFLKPPPPPPTPRRRVLTAREVAAARGALKSLRRLAAAEAIAPDYDDYGIPIEVRGEVPLMDFKEAISAIFKAAREHIDRASALLLR